MKINMSLTTKNQQVSGFTLIEMIGVLAVIAILAALLLPKVANAISEAKVNNTVGTYQTIQTAATDHYGKYSAFNQTTNGTILTSPGALDNWDVSTLIPEGFLDKPLAVKVGSGAILHVVTGALSNGGTGYLLDGTNSATSSMAYVVEIIITNVAPQDAFDISSSLDGTKLTPATTGLDTQGRVTCDATGLVHMFVTGR